jgi:hypothetical protein
MALSFHARRREHGSAQQEGDEDGVGCLVIVDKLLQPFPCLHVLATDQQRELWATEARVLAEQAREQSLVGAHRRAAVSRDKAQQRMRVSEDEWRLATAHVQQGIWHKCWLAEKESRDAHNAHNAHRTAAVQRDMDLRLETRRGDGVRRAVCEIQARRVLSKRKEDHAATAAWHDELQRTETLRQDARRLERAQKQGERRAGVQDAEEKAAMHTAFVKKHTLDAQRRLLAQNEESRLREHKRKAEQMRQQQAFLDACCLAHEKARAEELMASHRTSRLGRERAKRSQAAALEDARGAVCEQQQVACEAAAREEEELAQALERRAEEERLWQFKAAAVKLEAAKREKVAQAARQKEQCATNRMSAMARDRAMREEVGLEVDLRLEVSVAQEQTRQRAAAQERAEEQEAQHRLATGARDLRQRELALREMDSGGWRRKSAERQEHNCAHVRVREAQRREVREAALKSRHTLWIERREDAARKQALSYEGKGGLRADMAHQQDSACRAAQEWEREQERARVREATSAREAELIENNVRAQQEREMLGRQRVVESMWELRAAALLQDEACKELQTIEAEAARRDGEALAAHRARVQERDALIRADVLESDWVRKAVCVSQEEIWERVWKAEQEVHHRQEVLVAALCAEHRRVSEDRDMALRDEALESTWKYRAQALAQEDKREQVHKMEIEAAEERRREEEVWSRKSRKLEELWKAESRRREDEERELVIESEWVRRAVAAQQEEVWRSRCEDEVEQEVQRRIGEEEKKRVNEKMVRLEAVQRDRMRAVAREKERCAENRMSALMRETMLREEVEGDVEWRVAVSLAQEQRRGLAEVWEQRRAEVTEKESDNGDEKAAREAAREAKLSAMYREREEVVEEERKHAEAQAAMEQAREKLAQEMERQKEEEAQKAAQLRLREAAEEKAQVLEEFERMKERAIAKLEEEEAEEPAIYGSEEMEEEVKHILMAENDELRAPVDAAVEQLQRVGRAADDFVFVSDPKATNNEKDPKFVQAEADEIKFTLPSDLEDEMWAERDRALAELLDLNDMSDSQTDAPDRAPAPSSAGWARLPSVVTWLSSASHAGKRASAVCSGAVKLPAKTAPAGVSQDSKVVLLASNVSIVHMDGTAVPQSVLDGDEIQFVGEPEIVESKPVDEDLVQQLLRHTNLDQARSDLQVLHTHERMQDPHPSADTHAKCEQLYSYNA